jgi:Protein of unknown function (DUF3800)
MEISLDIVNEDMKDQLNENVSIEEKTISKEERVKIEKQEVLNRVVSGQIDNLRDRVAYILNYSNEARNSDIDLLWIYWETFERDKFSGSTISKEQMKELARIASLSRIRAKIQNEYKLFQAEDTVKRYRGKLEEDKRLEAIEDKPSGIGMYGVYIDETGKNQEYLSVGSLWILKFSLSATYAFQLSLEKWMKEKQIDFEFHFKDLSKSRLPLYKEFFIKFLTTFPETGFKLIVVNNKGFSDKAKAITDLTYHLISKGVEHENDSGRATLPRVLQVWIDEEEKGSDQLKIENIKERLRNQKVEGLHFGEFEAVSSKGSFFVQIVDLFTASINRKLHSTTDTHFKDEFADFVLTVLKFDISKINKQNNDIDNSTLFNLSEYEPDATNLII